MMIYSVKILVELFINGYHKLKYIKKNWVWAEIITVTLSISKYFILKSHPEWSINDTRIFESTSVLF